MKKLLILFLVLVLLTPTALRADAAYSPPQPICEVNPVTGKLDLCHCEPDENKNKISVLIKRGGTLDTEPLLSLIEEYFRSVEDDLNIEDAGVQKFAGATLDELDTFIEDVFFNEHIGYLILIGDDLPVAEQGGTGSLMAIHRQLELVGREYVEGICRDLAISYILPPMFLPDNEKQGFIVAVLEKYIAYHYEPLFHFGQYEHAVLQVKHDPVYGDPVVVGKPGYEIPVVEVYNSNSPRVHENMERGYQILMGDIHGAPTIVGLGLNEWDLYTSLQEVSSFVQEYGNPALFVNLRACSSLTIAHDGLEHCCWPQEFLKAGAWVYYFMGTDDFNGLATQEDLGRGMIFGTALRREVTEQNYIFGDILAHLPISIPGDLDGDCRVTIADIMRVAVVWNTCEDEAGFKPEYDFDNDGDIDIADIMYVAAKWDASCSE